MKTASILAIALLLATTTACGQQEKNVPETVKAAFTKKFPEAQKVKWGKENDGEWEAEFKLDNREYSANFNLAGDWLETEYEINESEIPETITTTLKTEFPGYKLAESEISETADGRVFEFRFKNIRSEVIIKPDGTLLRKKTETKKEDKEKNN